MSLFSNKQMRIIFIYCVIIILVICGIITARHKKTSSDSIVKTTKTNNETSESSDTQHTSDNTPNTDRLPPYNSSNQGNGIGGGAIMGNCSIGSRKLPIYCVDLSKKTNLLVVCHCYRKSDTIIRIISARKATVRETISYNKNLF